MVCGGQHLSYVQNKIWNTHLWREGKQRLQNGELTYILSAKTKNLQSWEIAIESPFLCFVVNNYVFLVEEGNYHCYKYIISLNTQ